MIFELYTSGIRCNNLICLPYSSAQKRHINGIHNSVIRLSIQYTILCSIGQSRGPTQSCEVSNFVHWGIMCVKMLHRYKNSHVLGETLIPETKLFCIFFRFHVNLKTLLLIFSSCFSNRKLINTSLDDKIICVIWKERK